MSVPLVGKFCNSEQMEGECIDLHAILLKGVLSILRLSRSSVLLFPRWGADTPRVHIAICTLFISYDSYLLQCFSTLGQGTCPSHHLIPAPGVLLVHSRHGKHFFN